MEFFRFTVLCTNLIVPTTASARTIYGVEKIHLCSFRFGARAVKLNRSCVAFSILVVNYFDLNSRCSKRFDHSHIGWATFAIVVYRFNQNNPSGVYTVVQNKPDSTNQAIVSCCVSYFKKHFNTIQELYVRKVLEILFVILGLKLGLNCIFLKIHAHDTI